jgi:sulfur relay (sulfurtransferase) DsrF/TusC family protein
LNSKIINAINSDESLHTSSQSTRFTLVFDSVRDSMRLTEGIDMGLAILAFEQNLIIVLSGESVTLAACKPPQTKPTFPALAALLHHGALACYIEQESWRQFEMNAEFMSGASLMTKSELEHLLQQSDVVLHV